MVPFVAPAYQNTLDAYQFRGENALQDSRFLHAVSQHVWRFLFTQDVRLAVVEMQTAVPVQINVCLFVCQGALQVRCPYGRCSARRGLEAHKGNPAPRDGPELDRAPEWWDKLVLIFLLFHPFDMHATIFIVWCFVLLLVFFLSDILAFV